MSGKFVRASKYRHVFGQAAKKELYYENLKVTINAWDSNLIKTNGKYISVNWKASGGGAFAVIPVEEVGKAPDQIPLFRGHKAHILDTDFDPFNEQIIASGSDDGKIGIWKIPENYSFHSYYDEDGNIKDISPVKFLLGHTRKVGHVLFHPTASNILASSSLDYTVRIWNVETGENVITLMHPDMVTSMTFSYNGDYLATVCRDKILRVWDIRRAEVISEGQGHTGPKNQRIVWLGDSGRLATTGFSKLSDRQIAIWDAFNLEEGNLGGFYNVDQSSGILMPFYDDSNKILYVAGKGDGNIRYYEFQDDELFELSEYQSVDPQRGFAVAPKKCVNVKDNEVVRAYKTVRDHCIEPISFVVPRKAEVFQDDIYPDAPSGVPALTAEEWLDGKSVEGPVLFSVKALYDGFQPTETGLQKRNTGSSVARSISMNVPRSTSQSPQKLIIKEPKSSPVYSSHKAKRSLDNALKNNQNVDKILQKACDFDELNRAENPAKDTSGWESDDEKCLSPRLSENAVNLEPVMEKSASLSPVLTIEKKNSIRRTPSVSPKKSAELSPKKDLQKLEQSPTRESPTSNSHSALTSPKKAIGLVQSVERLSSLILQLEGVVAKLTAASIEKDARLQQLEDKIEQLLQK
ncbi:HCL261Cp [Eremothecium sinecaudum]|uniref:Coronin n=1 Tax=Eremothecium sinecaudum TaxID=45286 RepID=A0A120K1Y7_9SACH|nr:HCL261Cp [Eremothecium sinecaudum]AMD19890.1 HCL261Cp [Eremothecium sinecaudum]